MNFSTTSNLLILSIFFSALFDLIIFIFFGLFFLLGVATVDLLDSACRFFDVRRNGGCEFDELLGDGREG